MGLRSRLVAGMAGQLARPDGIRGRLVATMLNRSNRSAVKAAVALLAPSHGDVVADVGFGGGLSLSLLLEAVGKNGVVQGVEISPVALQRAKTKFNHELSIGRLRLHQAPITSLPFADESLTGLMTVNTLYFVEDLDTGLREMARVIGAAGTLVIGLGDPDAMASMAVTSHGFRLRPIADVVDCIGRVGLKVVGHERVGDDDGAFHLLGARRRAVADIG